MATAGFVLGLVGLFPGFWIWWRQLPAVLATVFGVVGLRATKGGGGRRGLAIAALVLGIAGILAAAVVSIYIHTSDDCDVEGPFEFSCDID